MNLVRDAIALAKLDNPEHAEEIAQWASDPANLASLSAFSESSESDWHEDGVASFTAEDWTRKPGPRSQRRWVHKKTGQVAYADSNPGSRGDGKQKAVSDKPAAKPKAERPTVDSTLENVEKLRGEFSTEGLLDLAKSLHGHTVAELKTIKERLGIKASGRKAELAKKIAERALGGGAAEKPAAKAKPAPSTDKPKAEPKASTGKPNQAVVDLYKRAAGSTHDETAALKDTLQKMGRDELAATAGAMGLKVPPAWSKQKIAEQVHEAIEGSRESYARSRMANHENIVGRNRAKGAREMLADMTEENHAKLTKTIDDTYESSSAPEFAAFAEHLIGTKISGSKKTVQETLHSFIDRLRTSRAQTDSF